MTISDDKVCKWTTAERPRLPSTFDQGEVNQSKGGQTLCLGDVPLFSPPRFPARGIYSCLISICIHPSLLLFRTQCPQRQTLRAFPFLRDRRFVRTYLFFRSPWGGGRIAGVRAGCEVKLCLMIQTLAIFQALVVWETANISPSSRFPQGWLLNFSKRPEAGVFASVCFYLSESSLRCQHEGNVILLMLFMKRTPLPFLGIFGIIPTSNHVHALAIARKLFSFAHFLDKRVCFRFVRSWLTDRMTQTHE